MDLFHSINELYYELVLENLRAMNRTKLYNNLTYNSLLYLEVIQYNENCTPSFLAESLNVARSAVTIKVNELVAKGLVIKTPSTTDKRVYHLKVSSEFNEEYSSYDQSILSAIKEIEEHFDEKEIAGFTKMLDIIKKNYGRETS